MWWIMAAWLVALAVFGLRQRDRRRLQTRVRELEKQLQEALQCNPDLVRSGSSEAHA